MRLQFFKILLFIQVFGFAAFSFSQETIKGKVVDVVTNNPLPQVKIEIENNISTSTDAEGVFIIEKQNMPLGEQILRISHNGYMGKRLPIIIKKNTVLDLEIIGLHPDVSEEANYLGVISLTDQELDEDEGGMDNISGLLQASRDVFLNAAAYDFSATFFRPRGLDSENSKVLINGVEMNKIYSGRPLWSNWGGLNDAQRNQIFSRDFTASDYNFGGLSGTTNITMRASQYSQGGKVTYASSNRSYRGRIMGIYNTGLGNKGWAFSISLSRRFAEEGFVEGSLYNANSVFLAIEKKINDRHSINFTSFYTPNIRGKSSANTQEVIDLKGIRYNSYWGYQNGAIRNSRLRKVKEPVFMLNHFFDVSEKTQLNTNLAFQTGSVGNSRIDYGGTTLDYGPNGTEIYIGGGRNPDPSYYQNLPSYFLRYQDDPNYQAAYLAREAFQNNGQLDWASLYAANTTIAAQGGHAQYVLYEDKNQDNQLSFNSILNSEINENIRLNASISYKMLRSENFAEVTDLLGGNGYLDVDVFAENPDDAQSDLQNRNRVVGEGDKFKYHFLYHANIAEAFAQAQFNYGKWNFFIGVEQNYTSYQREGLFQNGNFPNNSLGKSGLLEFNNFSSKAGLTYNIGGNHFANFNVAQISRAPNLRNSFSNSRQNNDIVLGIESEQNIAADLSYLYRSAAFNLRLTGFYNQFKDATEIAFYYADGISGIEAQNTSTAFVQEVLSGIDKTHYGAELGLEYQITSAIKLKAAGSMGSYTFSNNPFLYLTSDDFDEPLIIGKSHLKNYKVAGGPQTAAQLGFEYRDPNFWWIGASYNYFANAYVDISPLTRTKNFYQDPIDGLPFNDYDAAIAQDLLEQEKFSSYGLVNLVGGKSWKIKDYYVGFFATINNVFNTKYKTGGFEQSRNANYRTLKEDKARDLPLFSPRYWFGYGTTYYLNFYVRF